MSWLHELPPQLHDSAYHAGDEAAWPAAAAIVVVEYLTRIGAAVCGVEVWVSTSPGPTIPMPYVYTSDAKEQGPTENWKEFVERANEAAAEFIRDFSWAPEDKAHQGLSPYFNFDVVQRPRQAK